MAENRQESSRDGLALVVGGLFILALVFAAYNYFNKPPVSDDLSMESTETSVVERIKEAIAGETTGDVNGNGAHDADVDEVAETGELDAMAWVATDYKEGDISKDSGSYTVKTGDTLWEIAEAVYGNGAEWTKVLDANSADVGFLPSGQQALIQTGQVLMLP